MMLKTISLLFLLFITLFQANGKAVAVFEKPQLKSRYLIIDDSRIRHTGKNVRLIENMHPLACIYNYHEVKLPNELTGYCRNDVVLSADGKRPEVIPEIPVKQNLSYRVEVEDQYAIRNRERIDYPVTAVPDRMPVILLERPENGGFYSPKRGIIYRISISDDYGVKDLDCRYEVLRRKKVGDYDRIETVSKGSLKLEEFTDVPMETKVSGTLDLKKMRLTPGCTVQLLFRVKDSHPKRKEMGESEMLEVNFVTDAELQEILKQEELQIYQNLSDVVDDMKHQRTIIHNILQKEEEKKK